MPMLIAWALVLGISLFLSGRWGDVVVWSKGPNIAAKEDALKKTSNTNDKPPAEPAAREGSVNPAAGATPQSDSAPIKLKTGADTFDQVFVLLAFLVCVAFSSFIALNFQPALIRLFAGYDLNFRFVTPLFQRKRKKWKQRWQENRDELTRLRDLRNNLQAVEDGAEVCIDRSTQELSAANLKSLNRRLTFRQYIRRIRQPSESDLIKAYALNKRYLKALDDKELSIDDSQLSKLYCKNLTNDLKHLKEQAGQQRSVVEARLQNRDRDRFFYFPLLDDDVMPTRFGNVIRAAEAYPKDRYKLSASLVWVWLEPLLPKEASKTLYDAKTSLDLMTTCSTLILLVGLPLSTWAGIQYAGNWDWWTPLIPALFVFLVRGSTLLWSFVGLFSLTQWILNWQHVGNQLAKANVLITLVTGVILISWLCYQSAVQAALSYGERYRVAFDQHRWKVLEALHLQLPRNFEDECQLWERVGKVLYRASRPDPYYWSYTKQATTREPGPLIQSQPATRPVPKTDLKKGHIIHKGKVAKYFEEGPIEREEEWIDAVQTMAELEGKKLIEPLSDGRPVPRSAIGQKTQTVAVGVPVTISTLMGGLVRPDDIVDLILVPASLNNSPPLEPILFADVRVIAIRSTSPTITENENPADQDHVVVVALPVGRRYEFATRSAGAKFIMSWSGKSAVPQADEEVAEIKILQGRTKTPTP
jgi:hypothetical protein